MVQEWGLLLHIAEAAFQLGGQLGMELLVSSHNNQCQYCYTLDNPLPLAAFYLSNYTLTKSETSGLSKGLGFCPTPGAPDIGNIIQDLDAFKRKTRLSVSKRIIYITFIEIKHLRINYLDDGRPSGQMHGTDAQW